MDLPYRYAMALQMMYGTHDLLCQTANTAYLISPHVLRDPRAAGATFALWWHVCPLPLFTIEICERVVVLPRQQSVEAMRDGYPFFTASPKGPDPSCRQNLEMLV